MPIYMPLSRSWRNPRLAGKIFPGLCPYLAEDTAWRHIGHGERCKTHKNFLNIISPIHFLTRHSNVEEFKRLSADSLPHAALKALKAFNDNSLKRIQTLVYIASVSISLSMFVTRTLGRFLTVIIQISFLIVQLLLKRGLQTADQVLRQEGCRVYKKFLKLFTFQKVFSFYLESRSLENGPDSRSIGRT